MIHRRLRPRLRGAFWLFGVAGVGLLPCRAFGQDEPASATISAARALGREGVKLAEMGNCAEAVEKFQRSEKLFHAPSTLARLGECQVQLGRIVDGTENLNRVAREVLPQGAPPAFVQAQERAKVVLAEARQRLAQLKIAVAAPLDSRVLVKVDGDVVPAANLNANRPMDPGEHVIEATAPGFKMSVTKIRLAEGSVDSIAVTLELDPNAQPVVTPHAEPPLASESRGDAPGRASHVPAYLALGVGVLGVGVGALFGLMASSKESDLDAACANKICPSNQQSTLDSAKSAGTVSTVGFVVGGLGLVSGTYLYLASRVAAKTPSVNAKTARSATFTASFAPYLGLDRAGITGRF